MLLKTGLKPGTETVGVCSRSDMPRKSTPRVYSRGMCDIPITGIYNFFVVMTCL